MDRIVMFQGQADTSNILNLTTPQWSQKSLHVVAKLTAMICKQRNVRQAQETRGSNSVLGKISAKFSSMSVFDEKI